MLPYTALSMVCLFRSFMLWRHAGCQRAAQLALGHKLHKGLVLLAAHAARNVSHPSLALMQPLSYSLPFDPPVPGCDLVS